MAYDPFKVPGYTPFRLPKAPKWQDFIKPAAMPETTDDILGQNAASRLKLAKLGVPSPPSAQSEPGFLEKVFGPLRAPAVGVQSVIHNALAPSGDRQVNPLEEMGKAFVGKESMTFGHITKDMGWNPQDTVGKVAKAVVDFGGEVATDPITWVTLGTTALVKEAALQSAKTIAVKGLTREMSVTLGMTKLFDGVEDSVNVLKGMGKLAKPLNNELFAAILKNEMVLAGDMGGLKLFSRINPFGAAKHKGISIVSQEMLEKATPAVVKRFIDAAKGTGAVQHAVGIFSPAKRIEFSHGPMTSAAFVGFFDEYGRALRAGEMAAADAFEALHDKVPATVNQFMAIAIERAVGQEARGNFVELYKSVMALDGQGTDTRFLRTKGSKPIGELDALSRELGMETAQKARNAAGAMGDPDLMSTAKRLAIETADKTEAAALKAIDKGASNASKLMAKAEEARALVSGFDSKAASLIDLQSQATAMRAEMVRLLNEEVDWDKVAAHLSAISGASDEDVAKGINALREYGFTEKNIAQRMTEGATGIPTGNRGANYIPHAPGDISEEVIRGAQTQADMPLNLADIEAGLPADLLATGPETAKFGKLIGGVDARPEMARPPQADSLPSASLGASKERDFETIELSANAGRGVNTDFIESLVNRVDQSGRKVAAAELRSDMAASIGSDIPKGGVPKGYRTLTLADGTKKMVEETLYADIELIWKPFVSDASASAFAKGWDTVNSIWRRWATTSSTGFVLRNAQSNYYLAFAHGYHNPASWEKAIKLVTGNMVDTDTISGKGWSYTVAEFKRLIHVEGVDTSGEISQMMRETKLLDEVMPVGRKVANVASGNTPSGSFGLTKNIGAFNQYTENTGRIAVFIEAMNRTGGKVAIASATVNRVLYSYDPAKLSPAMRSVRKLIPFIVWIRNNLPAMTDILLHDPSRISVIDKMQKASYAMNDGKPVDKDIMPQYMRDMIPLSISVNGKKALLNPNWGFQDLNKLEILVSAGKGDIGAIFKDFLAMTTPFLKVPAEFAFGVDSFYGTPLEKYPGQLTPARGGIQSMDDVFKGQVWWEGLKKATGAKNNVLNGKLLLSPKFLKIIDSNPFFSNMDKALSPGPQQLGRVLSWTAGIKVMPRQDEKWKKNLAYTDRQNIRDSIQKMKDEGVLASGR